MDDADPLHWLSKANEDITKSSEEYELSAPKDLNGQKKDPIEHLRELALKLNPNHGDKLYPLEVLGAYKIVNDSPLAWNFELGGNPEVFVDSQITKWMATCDRNRFKNRLERCINQDNNIKRMFLLRLNYAYLMEQGKDEITIHRGRTVNLEWYGAVDEFGVVHGAEGSSVELLKNIDKLDEIANSFYSNKQILQSKATGIPLTTRQQIKMLLDGYGYSVEEDLDKVYYQLNELNKKHLEDGLVARIAYLAFEADLKKSGFFLT